VALIGIDVGTSEVKASLFADAGECIASASAEYQPSIPKPGFAELDPEQLWSVVTGAIRRVQAKRSTEPVRALAFSTHGESFLAVDTHGKPLTPIILNIDGRANSEMDAYAAAFTRESLYRITGLPPHPMYTLPKIAWLRKHSPDVFERAAKFLCVHDYLLSRGTGESCLDPSLASRTLGYDIVAQKWSDDLLAQCGLSSAKLSRVAAGGATIGKALPSVVTETGLPADALWVVGGHDQACTSIGAGGLRSGTIVDGTGTFECISVASQRPLSAAAAQLNLPCERHTAPDHFLSLAYSPGGIVLKWFRNQFSRDVLAQTGQGNSPYELLLAGIPEQPSGLFVFPYLFGTGTPWLDSSARGLIYGFDFGTSRETLVRAALEGVTYEMRWNMEALERLGVTADRIMAVGGGAKSGVWLQLKADIFGHEVTAVPGEAACRGAAICAGIGAKVFADFRDGVTTAVRHGAVFEPRAEAQAQYMDAFAEYKSLAKRLYGFELPATGTQTHALGS
jgi:xylulokinase